MLITIIAVILAVALGLALADLIIYALVIVIGLALLAVVAALGFVSIQWAYINWDTGFVLFLIAIASYLIAMHAADEKFRESVLAGKPSALGYAKSIDLTVHLLIWLFCFPLAGVGFVYALEAAGVDVETHLALIGSCWAAAFFILPIFLVRRVRKRSLQFYQVEARKVSLQKSKVSS